LNLESAVWETLVADTDGAYDPDWSPDGQDIAYVQRTGEGNDVWIAPVDGSEPYQLTEFGAVAEPVWSPDGSQIAFIRLVGTEFEIWVADVERGGDGHLQVKDPEKLISAENIDAQSGLSWINP
jgi:Tol biopolymer transport system component